VQIKKVILIILLCFLSYLLYFLVTFFSVYPPIREYCFDTDELVLEQKLIKKVQNINGWSLVKTLSTKNKGAKAHYFSIFHFAKHQKYSFRCKIERHTPLFGKSCAKLKIIGAFDELKGTGGYKESDKDVKKLKQIFDNEIGAALVEPADL
jgi:hypothetical protein